MNPYIIIGIIVMSIFVICVAILLIKNAIHNYGDRRENKGCKEAHDYWEKRSEQELANFKRQAVENGYATWEVVDTGVGHTVFTWEPPLGSKVK